jgi:hypothetical protein
MIVHNFFIYIYIYIYILWNKIHLYYFSYLSHLSLYLTKQRNCRACLRL